VFGKVQRFPCFRIGGGGGFEPPASGIMSSAEELIGDGCTFVVVHVFWCRNDGPYVRWRRLTGGGAESISRLLAEWW